jgi:2-octaprenyl-6-methoxyphenol hydroxylase
MQIEADHDIVIAGGGLTGATLALALDQAGFSVAMVDANPAEAMQAEGFDGRASAIAFTALRQWRNLGVEAELDGAIQPMERIVVTDGPAPGAGAGPVSPFSLSISRCDLAADGDPEAGEPLGWMIENTRVLGALLVALNRSGVRVIRPAGVVGASFAANGGRLELESGETLSARLLISSEGRRSVLRRAAGITAETVSYGQTGVVATVALARPHEGTAWQHFMPAGPLAILPLTGDRASLVWTEHDDRARALQSMSGEAFTALLARRFGDHLGRPTLIGDRFGYPLSLQRVSAVTGPRLALVGDAAHGLHPISGQGLNLGLKDVAALTEVLADARDLGEDIGGEVVLERYARWRRLDVAGAVSAADLIARVFSNDHDSLRWLRGLALGVANGSRTIRGALAREAGGSAGDLPRSLALG